MQSSPQALAALAALQEVAQAAAQSESLVSLAPPPCGAKIQPAVASPATTTSASKVFRIAFYLSEGTVPVPPPVQGGIMSTVPGDQMRSKIVHPTNGSVVT